MPFTAIVKVRRADAWLPVTHVADGFIVVVCQQATESLKTVAAAVVTAVMASIV